MRVLFLFPTFDVTAAQVPRRQKSRTEPLGFVHKGIPIEEAPHSTLGTFDVIDAQTL